MTETAEPELSQEVKPPKQASPGLPTEPIINPALLAELDLEDFPDHVRKIVVVVEHPPLSVRRLGHDVLSHLLAMGIGSVMMMAITYAMIPDTPILKPAPTIIFEFEE